MATTNLVPCPDCGHLLSPLAETCPSCARPLRRPPPREGLFLQNLNQLTALVTWGPIALVVLFFVVAMLGGLWAYLFD